MVGNRNKDNRVDDSSGNDMDEDTNCTKNKQTGKQGKKDRSSDANNEVNGIKKNGWRRAHLLTSSPTWFLTYAHRPRPPAEM